MTAEAQKTDFFPSFLAETSCFKIKLKLEFTPIWRKYIASTQECLFFFSIYLRCVSPFFNMPVEIDQSLFIRFLNGMVTREFQMYFLSFRHTAFDPFLIVNGIELMRRRKRKRRRCFFNQKSIPFEFRLPFDWILILNNSQLNNVRCLLLLIQLQHLDCIWE